MVYIICEPCITVKDRACVDACPVICIYEGVTQLYIYPTGWIDCGSCEPECRVQAILEESNVPEKSQDYIEKERRFFGENVHVRPSQGRTVMGPGGMGETGVHRPPGYRLLP